MAHFNRVVCFPNHIFVLHLHRGIPEPVCRWKPSNRRYPVEKSTAIRHVGIAVLGFLWFARTGAHAVAQSTLSNTAQGREINCGIGYPCVWVNAPMAICADQKTKMSWGLFRWCDVMINTKVDSEWPAVLIRVKWTTGDMPEAVLEKGWLPEPDSVGLIGKNRVQVERWENGIAVVMKAGEVVETPFQTNFGTNSWKLVRPILLEPLLVKLLGLYDGADARGFWIPVGDYPLLEAGDQRIFFFPFHTPEHL